MFKKIYIYIFVPLFSLLSKTVSSYSGTALKSSSTKAKNNIKIAVFMQKFQDMYNIC